jgi:hypothetical protein
MLFADENHILFSAAPLATSRKKRVLLTEHAENGIWPGK